MKKILFVLCFIGLSLPVFSETTQDGQHILYCPHHIDCSVDGKLESCHMSDNQYGVWENPWNNGRVGKGIYSLKKVVSKYQLELFNDETICQYSLDDHQGIEKLMTVMIKGAGDGNYTPNIFNAFLGNSSQWSVTGWHADCLSSDPKLCPLVETPEIAYWSQSSENTYMYVSGGVFSQSTLSYNRLLSVCGASSICYVDIGEFENDTPEGRKFKLSGSVRVDLSLPDIINIVSISTIPTSPCIYKKKEPFNTIYCEAKK